MARFGTVRSNGSKELDRVLQRLHQLGWTLKRSAKGHIKALSPDGALIVMGGSGCPRGLKNAVARLRRAGVDV